MLETLITQIRSSLPSGDRDYDISQVLLSPDSTTSMLLGCSSGISADGSIAVLGAYLGIVGTARTGCAYVYERINGSYIWTQKLAADDGAGTDRFGRSVSISGDGSTIVIGAYYDDDKGGNSGSVYIFKRTATGYEQVQKLVAFDGITADYFGYGVNISGDGQVIAVGAYLDDDKGTNSGSVYIYRYDGASYIYSQKLFASDGVADDIFGMSVALSELGDTLVSTAYQHDAKGSNSGAVYVFKDSGSGVFTQTQKLTASDGAIDDFFGYSVAISADASTIAVGARGDDDKGIDSGSAYVFKLENGTYIQKQKMTPDGETAAGDYFGSSVGVTGDGRVVAVGCLLDDVMGTDSGSVYVYRYNDPAYTMIKKLTGDRVIATTANFGFSVACSSQSNEILVGATGWPNTFDQTAGAGFVFS